MEPIKEEALRLVFDQLQRCLNGLVGGSGHLASYTMRRSTFRITKTEKLGGGETRYFFTAHALLESEFTTYSSEREPDWEEIGGSIVLDENFDLTRDEEGKIKLDPWNCIDPDSHSV
jgi:hypothetical protein